MRCARFVIAWVLASTFVCAGAGNRADATPVPFDLRVDVRSVGPLGLVVAAGVQVDVCSCSALRTCFDRCESVIDGGITGENGSFFDTGYGRYFAGFFVAFVTVDDLIVRGFGEASGGHSLYLNVDPISEAAIEILAGRPYDTAQMLALANSVEHANARTDFAGLTFADAIERARAVAGTDPQVQALLPTWTPTETPTPQPTATPTPTRTLRPTGTPRRCTGDCSSDGRVQVDELITGVDIVLGRLALLRCAAGYPGQPPDVSDIIVAVNNALYGCEPSGALPDLVPETVTFASGPPCTGDYPPPIYCFDVCVANVGDNAAPPFAVVLGDGSGDATWQVGPLIAGDGDCGIVCNAAFAGTIRVDPDNDVPELRETNNAVPYQIATPTPPPTCPPPTPT